MPEELIILYSNSQSIEIRAHKIHLLSFSHFAKYIFICVGNIENAQHVKETDRFVSVTKTDTGQTYSGNRLKVKYESAHRLSGSPEKLTLTIYK